ncbi:MAG: protein-disulfide reductase DsbD family protein [Bacteroidales bacterium]
MNKISSLILFFLLSFFVQAQEAQWQFSQNRLSATEVELVMEIEIPENFHMYSFDQGPGGPLAAEVTFEYPENVVAKGGLQYDTEPREFFDDIFEVTVRDFEGTVTWRQHFTVPANSEVTITGSYTYQLCKDNGVCVNPFPEKFSVTIPALQEKDADEKKRNDKTENKQDTQTDTDKNDNETLSSETSDSKTHPPIEDDNTHNKDTLVTTEPISSENESSTDYEAETQTPWWIFIAGFLGGLLAFLTPCVFPMVPMTVSLFIKKERKIGIRDAIIYGLSIIVIYVGLGLAITALFGETALYEMSVNPIFNMLFFIIFVVFAISFFGAFEITLPSSWVNKMDQKVDSSSGLLSVFFMAFTLVLVSFSCTAMIIGTLLVESVHTGSVLGPFMGMLGFSVALALPFTFFAIFPSLLHSLPKSGGWLNTIKVLLGFVELALALKFISMADLAAGWGILPRDLFIAIWIVIIVFAGLYVLGKIKFAHDNDVSYISIPRLLFATTLFSFALYLLPGMWGAPLKPLSGYLPPMNTQTFDLYTPTLRSGNGYQSNTEYTGNKKYADVLDCPLGLHCFFDYQEGLAYAQKVNKPVLLDFTGKTCANCRDIELNIWSQPEVFSIINNDFVLISLYMDVNHPLPEDEQITEVYQGREYDIQTLADKWKFFSLQHYKTIAQPLYVVLDAHGNRLMQPVGYDVAQNADTYIQYLQEGIDKFNTQEKSKSIGKDN